VGARVTDVPGIATGTRAYGSSKGFWFQDPEPDSDPATSEGVFVFTSSPGVAVGDSVLVAGNVKDFYPLSSGDTVEHTSNLSVTEIGSPGVTVLAHGNPLPAAEDITPTTVPGTYAPDLGGGNIEATPITPSRSALDFWESREGMRVEVDDASVVGPSNDFGEQYVTTKPTQAATYRGGTELLAENATPPGRVEVVPIDGSNPGVSVSDVFGGATVGPVDYSRFGGYTIAASTLGAVQHHDLPRIVATAQSAKQLAMATYASSSQRSHRPSSAPARRRWCTTSSARSWPSTGRPTSWSSATSTTTSSARRSPRCGPARPTARARRSSRT
jgi:uncharacterized protein